MENSGASGIKNKKAETQDFSFYLTSLIAAEIIFQDLTFKWRMLLRTIILKFHVRSQGKIK